MAETYTIIHEEIEDELQNLKKMELGTDEYKATVDGVTKLIDREIELKKLDNDRIDSIERREHDAKLKQMEIDNSKKDRLISYIDRFIGHAITLGTFGISVALYKRTYDQCMNYEVEGVINSTNPGRNAEKKLLDFITKLVR